MFEFTPEVIREEIESWKQELRDGSWTDRFILHGFELESRVPADVAEVFFKSLAEINSANGAAPAEFPSRAITSNMILQGDRVDDQPPEELCRLMKATSLLDIVARGSGLVINYGINRMPGRTKELDYGLEELNRDIRSGEVKDKLFGRMVRGKQPMVWSAPLSEVLALYQRGLSARQICDSLGLGYEEGETVVRVRYAKSEVVDQETDFRIPTVLDAHAGGSNPYFRPALPEERGSGWTVDLATGEDSVREWAHPAFGAPLTTVELPDQERQYRLQGAPSDEYLRDY